MTIDTKTLRAEWEKMKPYATVTRALAELTINALIDELDAVRADRDRFYEMHQIALERESAAGAVMVEEVIRTFDAWNLTEELGTDFKDRIRAMVRR